MLFYYYLIIILPIVSLFLSLLLGNHSSKNSLLQLNIFFIFSTAASATVLFIYNFFFEPIFFYFILGEWFAVGQTVVHWNFLCDTITISMLFVVTFISAFVHLYSIEYMAGDPNHIKFMNYLTLFTLAMILLVTAGNLVQMFVGWEGVGICSFLLINFWDTRTQANTSALKAIIVNRVGDFGLVFSFILIYAAYKGNFNYLDLFSLISLGSLSDFHDLIAFFIFLGAVGKSAQLFLHVWLPDAMEGPTPVSALIHAATMVTAGIFIIIRTSIFFEQTPFVLKIVLCVGAVTALFAGSVGMVQMDLKKVIAYSTCSQLGFMAVACGLSAYDVALFHLAMHAFFKALLFLSAGSIIHAYFYDEQDIRRLGGGLKLLPFTYVALFIGSIALMGFPYTAGFFSKDTILELLLTSSCPVTKFSMICCFLASCCTSFYSIRLIFVVFLGSFKNVSLVLSRTHESSIFILIPLTVLSVLSLVGGLFLKESFLNLGYLTNNYGRSLVLNPIFYNDLWVGWLFYGLEELPFHYKLIPFLLVLFITFFTIIFYTITRFHSRLMSSKSFYLFFRFLNKKWYFDIIYSKFSRQVLFLSYRVLFLLGDRGFLEIFGPLGLTRSGAKLGFLVKKIHAGSLELYFSIAVIFVILVFVFSFFSFLF